MSSITQTITAFPPVPQPGDSDFTTDMQAFHTAEKALPAEMNAFASQANTLAGEANTANSQAQAAQASAESARDAAVAAANFHGTYAAGTTYSLGVSVVYNGVLYWSLQNSNTGNTPDSSAAYWVELKTTQSAVRWFL